MTSQKPNLNTEENDESGLSPSAGETILVERSPFETRVALMRGGRLTEYHREKTAERSLVTQVYLGKVTRVIPGMNCAFVDIGEEKAGFLFGGDVLTEEEILRQKTASDGDHTSRNITPIEKNLRTGDTILCQVIKDPLGSKGPRISMGPKIPGRFLVLMPDYRHVGISRRIEDEAERNRLTDLVSSTANVETCGYIIRTAAVGADREDIIRDIEYLESLWASIQQKIDSSKAPLKLYEDISLGMKIVRDILSDSTKEVICDGNEEYASIEEFAKEHLHEAKDKIKLYEKPGMLFSDYGIDTQLNISLHKKVPLKSGGHIVVEQTEALTSVDVNTGSFIGKKDARDTILKTNLEACQTIVEQLMIRNIGGIIVLDFIDMDEGEDREIVYNHLIEAFKVDRARTNILRMSELGLIQLTRKRTRESLSRTIAETCPSCEGHGFIKSLDTVSFELMRQISVRARSGEFSPSIYLSKDLFTYIKGSFAATFNALSKDLSISPKLHLLGDDPSRSFYFKDELK